MKLARVAIAALALSLIASACAKSSRPGVRVDAVQANIVFGVKQSTPGEVAPPSTPTYSGVSNTGVSTAPPPLRVPSGHGGTDFDLPTTATSGSCPQAPIGAAPSAAAAENASQPPAPGLYRYKIAGSQTLTVNGTTITSELGGFEPHIIRNVQRTSDTLWSYEVVTPGGSGGSDVTTWTVNTAPIEHSANPIVGKEVTVGEPARGVALSAIDSFDGNGNNTAEFRPTPAVLELPLPVVSGSDFNAVGVDSKSGQTEQVNGLVQSRQSVDACGTLVDGWFAHLDIKQTDGNSTSTRSEDDVFSTDLGGLLISQHITETETSGTSTIKLDVTYSLGQTTPSDLPAASS